MNDTVSDSALFSSSTADRRTMAAARGAIAHNRAEFAALESAALACEDPLEAVALARMAYEYAMFNHPGLLTSVRLESLLHDFGRLVPGTIRACASATGAERVLHVASEVYESGGHGRVLERWIEHDRERVPTVLLLNGDIPVPDSVVRAVASRNGCFARISRNADSFNRAAELRLLAARHDLIVLHIHNHEVIAAIALADPAARPPCILVNHASHLMWAGVGCADVVVNFSDLEAATSVARRGVPAQRSLVLPLPAALKDLPSRVQARAALGLEPDAPVMLTMATPYKLRPVFDVSYREIADAALEALPDATLLLVGPSSEDAIVRSDPRVRVLGEVNDPSPLFAAADILIDSWPLTGGTTVTDAAAAGLPILAFADPPRPILSIPESRLDGTVVRAADLDAFGTRLRELWENPDLRARLGERARAAIETQHIAGWPQAMESVLLSARRHHGSAAPPVSSQPGQITEWEAVIQAQRASDTQNWTLANVYARNIQMLPASRRPGSMDEVRARIEMISGQAPRPPRVLAAPRVERQQIERTLARMRELIAAGSATSGVILVAAELVDEAIALIEPAMSEGAEIDIELQVGDDPHAGAAPADIVLSSDDQILAPT
jgi:glycosyltransferase involved in cell wall biosynthesis